MGISQKEEARFAKSHHNPQKVKMNHSRLFLFAAGAGLMTACAPQNAKTAMDEAFAEAQRMADSITVPTFCADTFNITSFGASTTADANTNKAAICAAIDSCSATGGGVVLIPNGAWTTGPLTLKSNVNLHLADSASLLFSTNYADYAETVVTRWEGLDCQNLHPLIYADSTVNVAITGKGVIDGQGSNDNWWFMKGKKAYGYEEGKLNQKPARDMLLAYDRNNTPLGDRKVFGVEDALRPQLVNICNSRNVLIEGVTLKNSPFWTLHPLNITDLTVRGVRFDNYGPNGDGCDPEGCKNVLIEDCFFNTGDDCIAIKSGRNNDGRRSARPTENVYVRNCEMANGHGGVVLGSEISGGFKNLWVENCKMDSPELDRVIRIKTSDCRGGVIENVWVRNVTVGKCDECVLKINLLYEPEENCDHIYPPIVRNVNLKNVTSSSSKYGVFIDGLASSPTNVENINVEDCHFNGVEKGNKISAATNVNFTGLFINGEEIASPEL